MLCFGLKLLCYSKSKFRFPTPPPLPSTPPPARITGFCSVFLTTSPPIQTLHLEIIDDMSKGNGEGGGGVSGIRVKKVVMLLFLFFSGLR